MAPLSKAIEAESMAAVRRDLPVLLAHLAREADLGPGKLLVVGASTSEVAGARIGSATSVAIGQAIAEVVLAFAREAGCDVAFQCCEHLNRALVVEKAVARSRGLQEVTAIPVPGAGGAVAAAAYLAMADACLVSAVVADAGIDIGDTLIGMHLRPVAVPVRGPIRDIGQAHVVMARSRPPLIGGARAVYHREEARRRMAADAPPQPDA
ncbi:TIGR01440 family protein [Alicyclobacillus sendaiensis]|uniref:TIGR01440 family protein n=1 Tax=Alicyclobacillus sendaiensis TaxID=192387 RepID=UPI0026F45D89|nr:TIGR01440 family protein [Alicyclobacillus sendaiensis]